MSATVTVLSHGNEYRVTFADPEDISPKVEIMTRGKHPHLRNISRQRQRSKYLDISIKGRAILRGRPFERTTG